WISGTHEEYPTIKSVLHPDAENQLKDDTWEKIKNCKLPLMPSTQSAISSILLRFSLDVARVVAEVNHIGKLVYAGGDDAVIMAPLSEIMDIAREIRECFSKVGVIEKKENTAKMVKFDYNTIINDQSQRKEKTIYFSMGKNATGSAGISIAHYHNSLKDSLNHARQAEKFAKNVVGRDGFGIALLKRSGEHSLFGAKWELLEGKTNNQITEHKTLSEIINMIVSGVLSNQFITQIYVELETYFGFNEPLRKEIIMTRAKYLAKRHIHCPKERKEKNINRLLELFAILYELSSQIKVNRDRNMTDKEYEENVNKAKLENLRNFLSFISFYSRNIKSDKLKLREEANANS
ncbi:MAG: type III-B CRISPR-associated protein Cas10/Cmr2, partial [Elusimicrobiales bacterium]|nr:type III-B CRISPR-associated protein Cas10/Cmr2 [Elusimicrobiales bacterium]